MVFLSLKGSATDGRTITGSQGSQGSTPQGTGGGRRSQGDRLSRPQKQATQRSQRGKAQGTRDQSRQATIAGSHGSQEQAHHSTPLDRAASLQRHAPFCRL